MGPRFRGDGSIQFVLPDWQRGPASAPFAGEQDLATLAASFQAERAPMGTRILRSLVIAAAAVLSPVAAIAQPVESFYRGKTLSMIIGYPPAGANDLYARAVARHIGKHIPGNPSVVPRNMPGGGSLLAANHIFNVAPKDGTTLGLIVPTAPLEERL